MQNLHLKLTSKCPRYHNWHQTKHHNKVHWGVLAGFTLLVFGTMLYWTPISLAADTVPPTIPTNLTAAIISSSQINLSWTATTDNVGVTGYKVYRCAGSACAPTAQIATSATNSYSDTGLTASTAYTYAVLAYDAAGNESGKSGSVSGTTLAQAQTRQQTLEQSFNIVETFDNLQDWTGNNVYYSYNPADMPKKLDGSPSNWDLYSYQPGSPPAPVGPWIGNHGVEYTWGGSGKSLVIDYEKPVGYGPSRLGMYVGDGTPDSGYKKIYVFFMVKFHSGFFPLDQQNPPIFQNLRILKFLNFEAGFVKPEIYQTPANRATICLDNILGSAYGTNDTFWNLFSTSSLDDLLLDEMLTRVASWHEGLGCYTNEKEIVLDRRIDEARFGSKYLANEWIGMEFMMDIGTLGNNDGSAEVWVYDQNGNETGHNLSTGIIHMQQFNELYNKIVVGGNRQFQDPDTNEDRFYVDDFIINGSRIGPKYFSLINGTTPPPDTTPPTTPTDLAATAISSSQINLTWTASTDDVGVTGYKVYRNGQFVNSQFVNSLIYNDTGLTASTAYTYAVSAYDAAGNESAKSSSVSATTLSSFKPSDLNQDTKVDQLDFDILKQDYNRIDKPKSDLNQDGIVDSRDLGIMMSSWSK